MSIITVHGPLTWGTSGGPSGPGKVYTGPLYASITASDAPNAAKLLGLGINPSPATAWTTGQKITVNTFDFNWSGSAWAAGAHA